MAFSRGERWIIAAASSAPGPATMATRVTSAGLLRNAIPNPSASSTGKANTQKITSGSRLSSFMRAISRWVKPDQRPLRRGGRGSAPSVRVEGVCWATVIGTQK